MSTEKEYSFETRTTGEEKETDHVSGYDALITKHRSGELEEIDRIVGTAINQACQTNDISKVVAILTTLATIDSTYATEKYIDELAKKACHTGSIAANKVVVASIKEKALTPTQSFLGA
jgi:hypothetical protein